MNSTTSSSASACVDASSVVAVSRADYAGSVLMPSLRITDGRTVRARKPSAGNHYTPSIYRPFVPARDRIQRWSTPYSLLFAAQGRRSLSHAFDHMQLVSLASVEWKTREVNAAGLLRFAQFCDKFRVTEIARMPASDALLAAFASSGAAKVGSAQHWIDGLHLWHDINGAPWRGGPLLDRALKGVKKLAPESSRRPPRPPVTYEHLVALLRGLDLDNTKDCAVWAAASTAFWSCCRLGELLPPSATSFDSHKHVSRSSRLTRGITRDGTAFATLHIPFSKTTGNEGADIAITESPDPTSPLAALDFHLQVNTGIPDSAPFFSFKEESSWAPLTKEWFMARCNEVWEKAGLTVIGGGHSFRIGGVTELLMRGVPPEVVAKQGRWKSDAFLKYWRRIETIVPFLISRSLLSFNVSRVSWVMDTFSRSLS